METKPSSREFTRETQDSPLKFTTTVTLHSTTVHLLDPPSSAAKPFITATSTSTTTLLHPLTSQPTTYILPPNSKPTTLAVSHNTSVSAFDKLLLIPTSLPSYSQRTTGVNKVVITSDNYFLLGLRHGGHLFGCSSFTHDWVKLSCSSIVHIFDDIAVNDGLIYAVDTQGRLYLVHITPKLKRLSITKTLISTPLVSGSGRFRKRLIGGGYRHPLHLVVRLEEKVFKVYSLWGCAQIGYEWRKVDMFRYWGSVTNRVLFLTRDCYFFRTPDKFLGKEFGKCIVFSEGAFPVYGDGCWEFPRFGDVCRCEDDIAVFRLDDEAFGRQGEDDVFPKLDWSPPPWVCDAWSAIAAKSPPHSSLEADRVLDANRDKKDETVQSDLKDSNSKHNKDGYMHSDLVDQERNKRP